jgi:hypothetical protein
VIVVSDHGEEFGGHFGVWDDGHGHSLYEEITRVPLVVVGPSVRRGRRVRGRWTSPPWPSCSSCWDRTSCTNGRPAPREAARPGASGERGAPPSSRTSGSGRATRHPGGGLQAHRAGRGPAGRSSSTISAGPFSGRCRTSRRECSSPADRPGRLEPS